MNITSALTFALPLYEWILEQWTASHRVSVATDKQLTLTFVIQLCSVFVKPFESHPLADTLEELIKGWRGMLYDETVKKISEHKNMHSIKIYIIYFVHILYQLL